MLSSRWESAFEKDLLAAAGEEAMKTFLFLRKGSSPGGIPRKGQLSMTLSLMNNVDSRETFH